MTKEKIALLMCLYLVLLVPVTAAQIVDGMSDGNMSNESDVFVRTISQDIDFAEMDESTITEESLEEYNSEYVVTGIVLKPEIRVEPDKIKATMPADSLQIVGQVTIGNDEESSLTYEIFDDSDWLAVFNSGGILQPKDETIILAVIYTNDLRAGNHSANITIMSNDINNAVVTIPVSLTVNGSKNQLPIASISASLISGEAPFAVDFTGTGTDSDGMVVSYEWTFGDGASSTEQNPIHIYTTPGTYTAILTVTDNDGATGSNSTEIKVWLWVNPVNATASSCYNKMYVAENAIDDNRGTRWLAGTGDCPVSWIWFDLGSVKQVGKVKVIVNHNGIPVTLDVQVSNDTENWDTIVSQFTINNGDIFVEIPFAQTTNTRYIRLWNTNSAKGHGTYTEFDAYASGDANTGTQQ